MTHLKLHLFLLFTLVAQPVAFSSIVLDFEDEFPGTPGNIKGLSETNFTSTANAGHAGQAGYFEDGFIVSVGAGTPTLYDSNNGLGLAMESHRGGALEDFVLMGSSHSIVITRPDGAAFNFESIYVGAVNATGDVQLEINAIPLGAGPNIIDNLGITGTASADIFPTAGPINNITSLTISTDRLAGIDEIGLSAVPEPSSIALLGCVATGIVLQRRRRG